eukprot:1384045-Prymnesium_polylepis.2
MVQAGEELWLQPFLFGADQKEVHVGIDVVIQIWFSRSHPAVAHVVVVAVVACHILRSRALPVTPVIHSVS